MHPGSVCVCVRARPADKHRLFHLLLYLQLYVRLRAHPSHGKPGKPELDPGQMHSSRVARCLERGDSDPCSVPVACLGSKLQLLAAKMVRLCSSCKHRASVAGIYTASLPEACQGGPGSERWSPAFKAVCGPIALQGCRKNSAGREQVVCNESAALHRPFGHGMRLPRSVTHRLPHICVSSAISGDRA